ncbi:N-acetylmuramoyl-L-alanine amidase [Pseudonocardia sp. DSM 110487]|uniref:N-acetylmuramoyl-L-alanine amidase n=1 Tax=Pseudonocardia sp. DSM 110487 TaxID=2865833 RepID=UPI001C6A495F|nr:N-acetylmuramoyl-L-alanine amidase [Pseudonocardia sp. DSM 110487]QYN35797.1 N-acetylmuramoyl-L-alanine amidase [Pseudonocardia sp. DSM 110487]
MQLLRRGDSGPGVVEIRSTLRRFGLLPAAAVDEVHEDVFDADAEQAVRAFQQQRGLITDGIVGPATYRALREAGWQLGDRMLALMISAPMSGDDVVALQERLLELGYDPGRAGGVFDEQTEAALRKFQREYGLVPDGLCGPATLRSLRQLGRKVTGGRPALLREQELLRQAGPRLRGKRIVVDPGHGGPDRGVVVAGVAEADIVWDLARRLVGRMTATGMDAMLSRQEDTCPTETERAAFANHAGADLVLSLHTDANRSMHAQGLATFHFGNGSGATSTVGEALAGFIQRELLTRTGMQDCRTQARTWELLRLTRMPTVRVEIGYLTHIGDRRRLLDPAFRDVVAEGILVAVKRLYLLGQDDQPTGTFTFSDVLARELERGGAQAI